MLALMISKWRPMYAHTMTMTMTTIIMTMTFSQTLAIFLASLSMATPTSASSDVCLAHDSDRTPLLSLVILTSCSPFPKTMSIAVAPVAKAGEGGARTLALHQGYETLATLSTATLLSLDTQTLCSFRSAAVVHRWSFCFIFFLLVTCWLLFCNKFSLPHLPR